MTNGRPVAGESAVAGGAAPAVQSETGHKFYREIERFCTLATVAPGKFSGVWRMLYEYVRERDEFWVFPTSGRWRDDGAEFVSLEPYLDKSSLAVDWARLLTAAESFEFSSEAAT